MINDVCTEANCVLVRSGQVRLATVIVTLLDKAKNKQKKMV